MIRAPSGGGCVTTTDLREGSARLVLLNGVTLLHPEGTVFEAMLEGWTR
jgi:integrase/recombinase XerC